MYRILLKLMKQVLYINEGLQYLCVLYIHIIVKLCINIFCVKKFYVHIKETVTVI